MYEIKKLANIYFEIMQGFRLRLKSNGNVAYLASTALDKFQGFVLFYSQTKLRVPVIPRLIMAAGNLKALNIKC